MKSIFAMLCFFIFSIEAHASLLASPSSVNFSSVDVGAFRSQTVFIRNNSDEDIHVSVSDSCMGDFYTSGYCGSLSRYGSCSLRVEFHPRRAGYQGCGITVRQITGGFDQVYINVSGHGVERRR